MQAVIKELLDHESGVCISLIAPTAYKAFGEREKVRRTLKNEEKKICHTLEKRYDKSEYRPLCQKLSELIGQIDALHPPKGIAIFLTSRFSKLVPLPFEVEPKSVVSDSFEIQDLLYNLDKMLSYYVLHLSKNHTRLFKGAGNSLSEVKDGTFPMLFEDPYEEDRPKFHALYSKDPSKVNDHRLGAFWREVHQKSAKYIGKERLFLVGLDKYISQYTSVGKPLNCIDRLVGNYDKLPLHEMQKLICPLVEKYEAAQEKQLCEQITRKIALKEGSCGINSVLKELKAYRGPAKLVVEKDFEMEGFIDTEDGSFLLDPLENTYFRKVSNVVGHVVEHVLRRKGGEVHVVPRGCLSKFQQIVLL